MRPSNGVTLVPAHISEEPRHRAAGGPRGFVRYTLFAAVVTILGYSLGYSTIGFGLLFFGVLWSLASHGRVPWVPTSIDVPLAVFGVVLLGSALASPYHRLTMEITLVLLVSGIVYFGTFTSLLHAVPGVRTQMLRAWSLGAILATTIGLAYNASAYRFMAPGAVAPDRAEIPRGVGPNGLGTTLMLGSVVSLGLALSTRGRERALWAAGALFCLAGLLASGSRASLVGWIAGAGYLVWRELRVRPVRMIGVGALGLALLVAIIAATPQFSYRLRWTLKDVTGNRVQIWHRSLQMVADHPWLGTGFGTFQHAYDERRPAGTSPEPFAFNLWLNLAVETGLLGLAAALWVAIAAVRTWRLNARARGHDPWRPTVAALWVGLLVDQFADNTLFSISTSAALWLLLALVVVRPAEPRPGAPTTSAQQIAPSTGQ